MIKDISKQDILELMFREHLVGDLSIERFRANHLAELAASEFEECAQKILAKYKIDKGSRITFIDGGKNQITVEKDGKDSS